MHFLKMKVANNPQFVHSNNQTVARQNFNKLQAVLLAKGVKRHRRGSRPSNISVTFEPNQINVYKYFLSFGFYFGTVVKYDSPYYEVIILKSYVSTMHVYFFESPFYRLCILIGM
jgi:hypothetical protein